MWVILIAATMSLFSWRISDCRRVSPFEYMASTFIAPTAACDYIASHNLPGPLFNDANFGGYVIWRLSPRYRTFVDSRHEPFLDGVMDGYLNAAYCTSPGSWRQVFDKYHINLVLVDPILPVASVLSERPDWTLVYRDDLAVVFVRSTHR